MKQLNLFCLLGLLLMTILPSCQSNGTVPNVQPKANGIVVSISSNSGLQLSDLKNIEVNVKNVDNSDFQYDFHPKVIDGKFTIDLPVGVYNIILKAQLSENEAYVYTYLYNVRYTGTKKQIIATFYKPSGKSGLVLSELFTVGSLKPDGKGYRQSKYFIIYNNSDHLIYADSVVLCETEFRSDSQRSNLQPVILDNDVPVHTVYMIPGNGHDVPLKPGDHLLIADIAKDHSLIEPNYPDLSKANFEWYDESPLDEDIPTVPNLIKIYSYSKSVWTPFDVGSSGYLIAKMPVSSEKFIADYKYEYTYQVTLPKGPKTMHGNAYKIPNDWVIDAVNITVKDEYKWAVMSPKLDQGFTYVNVTKKDRNRDIAVIRKISSTKDGHIVYQDTNNSTVDFEQKKPSMAKNN